MTDELRDWLDQILSAVQPLSREDVQGMLDAWCNWAWFQAHDEDCRQDFMGAHDLHLRLVITLQRVWQELDILRAKP